MPVDRLTHVCEKCERNREGLPKIPVEHVDGRGPGWKCDECGWWNWIEPLPVEVAGVKVPDIEGEIGDCPDRLTRIRHNWQEKGNGPRGRDVDFLLGLLADRESEVDYHSAAGEAEQEAERYREAHHVLEVFAFGVGVGGGADVPDWLRSEARSKRKEARDLLALPATESAREKG